MLYFNLATISFLGFLAASAASTSNPSASQPSALLATQQEWSGWGANVYNNRWASTNTDITSSTVKSLSSHCKTSYHLGTSANPVVKGAIVYYPTWNGLFVAQNYHNCKILWQLNVTSLVTSFAPITPLQEQILSAVSRTSPQLDGDVLYFGTLIHALLFAVDRNTGQVLAHIQTSPHPVAILTMSPTFYKGRLYIGVSSQEQLAASDFPGYVCCSFEGIMLGLEYNKAQQVFNVLWNVSMLPEDDGWAGSALWGSQPAIDEARSQLLIATGDTYTIPPDFILCQNQSQQVTVVAEHLTRDPCLPDNVYQESVLALDLATGLINWVTQLSPLDAYIPACISVPKGPNCPYTPGPDADFGMAPTFVPGSSATPYGRDIVVVGQKNGNLYALSAQAGRIYWATATSPDGTDGGLTWGIAVDAHHAYFTAVNFAEVPFTIPPSGSTINNSAIGAARLSDGALVWETQILPNTSLSLVPPSVVNDVVFVGRTGVSIPDAYVGSGGELLMYHKSTGVMIHNITLDANFHGGIMVQDEYVIFGTGYQAPYAGNGSLWVLKV